jgi:outer membrane protein
MALERALIINPDFDSARLELGRTYLRMGSLDLAATEFQRLLSRMPNPSGKVLLERYLTEIQQLRAKSRYSLVSYFEFGGGYDSNLSSAADDFANAVQRSFGLIGITPTGNSIKRQAAYAALTTGLDIVNRYREDRTFFVSALLRGRGVQRYSDFSSTSADINTGHEWRFGEKAVSLSTFTQYFNQDGASDPTNTNSKQKNTRSIFGVTTDYRMPLSTTSQIGAGLQFGSVRYDTNKSQDTDLVTASLLLQTAPASWKGTSLSTIAFFTKEKAKRTLNAFTQTDASRKNMGLRITLSSNTRQPLSWTSSLGWTRRTDDDSFARASLVERGQDNQIDLQLKLRWNLTNAWSVQPYINATDNRSNIALYSFKKIDAGFIVRKDFN